MKPMRAARVLGLCVLASGLLVSIDTTPAAATSITVNTALDIAPDATTGHFPTDGKCSLRAAIQAAQFNSNANDVDCATGLGNGVLDTIHIDPSLAGSTMTLTYANANGVQPFDNITGPTNPLEIIGPTTDPTQFVISGGDVVRPFDVGVLNLEAGNLKLANLTVSHGNGNDNGGFGFAIDGDGGAFYLGQSTQLTLDNVNVRDNHVTGSARGGAIYGIAPTITNNGGAYIGNSATGGGTFGRGGAIFVEGGPWTINGYAMLLQGNVASFAGGAIATNPGGAGAFAHFERSLLRDNSAANGGIFYADDSGSGEVLNVTDSTFFNNTSVLFTISSRQTYTYLRDTFVNSGQIFRGGGGFMANSIVTGNSSCTNTGGGPGHTGSRNLLAGSGCAILGASDIGDVTGLAPSLAQNGGPQVQQTFALNPPSNAIDNGDKTYCGTIDARSVARGVDGDGTPNSPQQGDCDIGAYEYAKYVVNFTTGTSSVNENAGTVNIPVKLRILDASSSPLATAVNVNIALGAGSTASIGPDPQFNDIDVPGNHVTFPVGSVDGAIANLVVNVHQDDVAEAFGENALIDLVPGGTPGVSIAEPKEHELSIQDDDQAGVVVDDGGNGTTVAEATPLVGDAISVHLQSRPDLSRPDPNNFSVTGPPADVNMSVEPDRDCIVKSGASTGSAGSPLQMTILNADWQLPHTFNVFAVNDLYDEDLRNEAATHVCELRFTFTSLDPVYKNTQDAYEVTVQDNDVAGVNVVHVSGSSPFAEGSTDKDTYTIDLATPPDPGKPLPSVPRGPTQVVITPDAACDVGNGPGVAKSFLFDDSTWNVPQTLDVKPSDNLKVELLHGCTVTSSIISPDPVYANLDDAPPFAGTPPTITEQIQDYAPPGITDDPPFVIVNTTDGLAVSEATPNIPDVMNVSLLRAPVGAPVTVTLTAPTDPAVEGVQLQVANATQPSANSITLTFDANNWNIAQTVEVRAVDDDFDEPDTHIAGINVTVSSTAPGFSSSTLRKVVVDGVATLDSGTVSASITDNDTSAVVLTETGGSTQVAEGGATDTVSIALATHPYQNVTVTLTADPQCTVDGGSARVITIPAANWNMPTTVTVAAVDDDVVEAPVHSCQLTATAASTDLLYQGLTASATAAVTDNDQPLVSVTAGSVQVAEGGASDTFDVVLGGKPTADVTITFATPDGQTTVTPSITFTTDNWNMSQTVTVMAVDDAVDEASTHTGSIDLGVASTAPGYDTAAIIEVDGTTATAIGVEIADNDTAGVVIPDTSLTLTEAGATDSYTIALATQPTGSVTVTPVADGLCTVSAPLTFTGTDWFAPQTVTVTPGNDDIVHTQNCTVSHTVASSDSNYQGITVPDAAGVVTDNDVAGVTIVAGSLTLSEATPSTSATFTVVLNSEPLADVTVTPSVNDGQTTVTGGPLTFSNVDWDIPQPVTVNVVDDTVVEPTPHDGIVHNAVSSTDPTYATAPFRVDGIGTSDIAVAITDDDTTISASFVPAVPNDGQTTSALVTVIGRVGAPTGNISLTLDGIPLPNVTLAGGNVTVDLGRLTQGTHTLVATYNGDAADETSTVTRTFTVAGVPVATADNVTMTEDDPPTAVDVLANDTDADGDTLTVSQHTDPSHGTATCTATNCMYHPAANFNGSDSFTYMVTDGTFSTIGTVSIVVDAVNDLPVLGTVAVQAVSGTAVTFNVLAAATDLDGDSLTVSSFTQPAHGTVACTSSGSCTYTSTSGYTGPDEFTYTVTDGSVVATAAVRAPQAAALQPAAEQTTGITGTAHVTVLAAQTTGPADGTGGASGTGGTGGTGSTTGAVTRSGSLTRTGWNAAPIAVLGFVLVAVGMVVMSVDRRRPKGAHLRLRGER